VTRRPSGGRSPKRRRLSRSAEFERVYRQGRSKSNRFLVLYAFPRTGEDTDSNTTGPRLGLSVSRRVGGAVDRSRVKRVLRLFGMVNCTGDFAQMPQVIDGASDLFFELWGPELGRHARSAVGHVALPRGIAVEINGEFELVA
jgi:hypothetical protein